MFWTAAANGLSLLLRWKVWALLAAEVGIYLLLSAFVSWGTIKAQEHGFGIGCLGMVLHWFNLAVLYSVLVASLVAFLLPMMFGGDSISNIPDTLAVLPTLATAGLEAVFIVCILSFVPLVGGLFEDFSVAVPIAGCLILRKMIYQTALVLRSVGYTAVSAALVSNTNYATALQTVGFVLLGAFLRLLIVVAVTAFLHFRGLDEKSRVFACANVWVLHCQPLLEH